MVQGEQNLDGGQLGGGRRGGAAVVVQGHARDRPAALTLSREQQRSPSRVLRGQLRRRAQAGSRPNEELRSLITDMLLKKNQGRASV